MKTQAITLIIAILGVLHGPLIGRLLTRARTRRQAKPPAAAAPAGYPAIRLRISTPSGVILETDTEELLDRAALYRRNWDGWFDLIAGGDAGTTEFSTVPLKIEVKPVRISEA